MLLSKGQYTTYEDEQISCTAAPGCAQIQRHCGLPTRLTRATWRTDEMDAELKRLVDTNSKSGGVVALVTHSHRVLTMGQRSMYFKFEVRYLGLVTCVLLHTGQIPRAC